MADSTDLDELIQRVSSLEGWKIVVDASIEDISIRLSESLKSAKITSDAVVDNSTLIRLTTTDNADTDSSTIIKITGSDYIIVDSSAANNILLSTKIGEVSTATEDASGLATANDVKEYVDTKIAGIGMTFDSSTPSYISTSVIVNNGQINSSVGVITASLADASNGSIGLAMAQDVYKELVDVEEVITTAQIQIANKVGLDSSLNLVWSEESGITEKNIKEAVENILLNINSSISGINSSISNISINALNDSLIVNNSSISFSSDTSYIYLSASNNNLALNSSIITLADASNGLTGLAIAQDVYKELVDTKEVITAMQNQIANKVGLDSSLNLVWSEESGITSNNIKEAVENIDASIKNISINALNNSLIVNNSSVLFNSDTSYIYLSASDNKLLLNSSIITLADASNGSTGLPIAQNVYKELITVEKVTAAALTALAITLGIDSSFNVKWGKDSGIPLGTNYKNAIEIYRNYSAGLGLSLNSSDRIFSLNPATSSSIGGVKIADASISGITLDIDGSISIVGPSVEEIVAFLEED